MISDQADIIAVVDEYIHAASRVQSFAILATVSLDYLS